MRETTALLKRLFTGELINHVGRIAKLDGYQLKMHHLHPPQILFGVRGEKLLTLAGQMSDGVIFSGPKDYLYRAKQTVKEAAEKAGRNERVAKLIWIPFINVRNEKDIELAKLVVATIASSLPDKEVYRQNTVDEITRIKEAFMKGHYKDASRHVSSDMLKNFCFAGDLDEILEEIEHFGKAGFDEVVVGPPFGGEPVETLKSLERFVGV
jgi:alkanesulfonate monooxygenase SsuD/methylene tetrahydromethanopterin reductase-like flavin-dependent oxidoreductase (luciferase family)